MLDNYLTAIRSCDFCADQMSRPPAPVLQASSTARILIAGQAPGNLAAKSGIPFSDPSGNRLRDWMGVSDHEFYDSKRVAIIPMGFCFPGYDEKGGDLPPMKVCAEKWRSQLLSLLPHIEVTLLVGGYAQRWHLGQRADRAMTKTVMQWRDFSGQGLFPLPHPSWRNNAWLKKNTWFQQDMLPVLKQRIRSALSSLPASSSA